MARPTATRRWAPPAVHLPRLVRRRPGRPALALATVALLALAPPPPAGAQIVEGRVLDEEDESPVATALVRLFDAEGEPRGVVAADSLGRYRIVAPEPGVYRLRAERIGYEPMETPLLEMARSDVVYPLELLVRPAPIPIAGLEVTDEDLDRRFRLLTGISPRSMRWDPIRRDQIVEHVEKAHDLTALMRWGNYAGVEVREHEDDGPCYLIRRYGCLPVFLDGFSLNPEVFDLVPLESVHTILVMGPQESIVYPRGAVLMYTRAWAR